MDRQLVLQWFAYVRPMYWPVLCLEIVRFYLWAWADAETHGFARQVIIAVNDHGRIRVRFVEDAPCDDWRVLLTHHTQRLPGENCNRSLMLSHCMWAAFQSRTPSLGHVELVTEGFAPPRPVLDPG